MGGQNDNLPIARGVGAGTVSWGPRIFGPLALIAVLVALFAVISTSGGGDDGASTTVVERGSSNKEPGSGADNPKEYAVESGDTLSAIAAKFDVSTKRLLRLNPGIDPQALATGTELKIR